jgi:hypothetical protein
MVIFGEKSKEKHESEQKKLRLESLRAAEL